MARDISLNCYNFIFIVKKSKRKFRADCGKNYWFLFLLFFRKTYDGASALSRAATTTNLNKKSTKLKIFTMIIHNKYG